MDAMQDILIASHQRSVNKSSENESEEEFTDYTDAPDIICESFQAQTTAIVTLHWQKVASCEQLLGLFEFPLSNSYSFCGWHRN